MLSVSKLKFEPVGIDRAEIISSAFETQNYRTSNFTCGSAVMWRKIYDLKICEYAGTVILSAVYRDEGLCYSVPVGKGDVKATLQAIYENCRQNGQKCVFSDVPEPALDLLYEVFGKDNCTVTHYDSWDDYVYSSHDLITYSGKKYNGQRNHVNKFTRLYPDAELVPISEQNYDDAFGFLRRYIAENSSDTESGEVESCADIELMKHFFELNLYGAVLTVGGKIVSISVGEQVGDTLFIHIEKGVTDYQGVYQVMVQRFAEKYAGKAEYINREEDDGVEGLRKSKLSYHPAFMLRKFSVEIK